MQLRTLRVSSAQISRVVALGIAISGLVAVLSTFIRPQRSALGWLIPRYLAYPGRALTFLLGLGLMYLALQLLRAKRMAWVLATSALAILVCLHLVLGFFSVPLIYFVIALGSLIVCKDYFKGRSEIVSIRNGLALFVLSLIVALGYGILGFRLMDKRDFGIDFTPRQAFTQTIREYALVGSSAVAPRTRHADWFLDSLGLLGGASILFGLYSLFRPLAYEYSALPSERRRMIAILKANPSSTEDYFKIWPHDKSYFFTPGDKGGVAYGVAAGIAVVVGGPAGPAEQASKTIRAFNELCMTNGWIACYMLYLNDTNRPTFEASGHTVFKLGEEAHISLATFEAHTSRNKHFRNVSNRFKKAEYEVLLSRPPHAPGVLRAVAEVSADWLGQPNRSEGGFFTGRYSPAYMAASPLYLARDKQGKIQAFINQIPTYQAGWATIDLMRYRRSAPPNVMDFLIMHTLLMLSNEGYVDFNLGLAPLAGLESGKRSQHEMLLNLLYRSNQTFVSAQGLRRFKNKFEPIWESRFGAYQGSVGNLPKITYGLGKLMYQHTGVKFFKK